MNSAEWFNRLESVLEREAEHAGVLEHGTMIGSVREFITRRVLQSFLPPVTHFGAGKVIDSVGNDSRQVDVILFDGRFPHFSSHGMLGLYPVEGVLATVEIKSGLTKDKVAEAFENCSSVSERLPRTGFRHTLDEVKQLYVQKGMNPDDAYERRLREMLVPTYVFSFQGPATAETLANSIVSWIETRAKVGNLKAVYLPRLIVAGNLVAVLNDGLFNINRVNRSALDEKKVLYLIAETPHRFGWLATHLISSVCGRLGTLEIPFKQTTLDPYLPVTAYIQEFRTSQNITEVSIDRKCCQPVEGFLHT